MDRREIADSLTELSSLLSSGPSGITAYVLAERCNFRALLEPPLSTNEGETLPRVLEAFEGTSFFFGRGVKELALGRGDTEPADRGEEIEEGCDVGEVESRRRGLREAERGEVGAEMVVEDAARDKRIPRGSRIFCRFRRNQFLNKW